MLSPSRAQVDRASANRNRTQSSAAHRHLSRGPALLRLHFVGYRFGFLVGRRSTPAQASDAVSPVRPAADGRAFYRASLGDVAQRRLDRGHDEVQAQIDQINPRQREHQIAADDYTGI